MYEEKIPWAENNDEAAVPQFSLPDALRCQDGTVVRTVAEWEGKRRPELLQLFKDVMYGEFAPLPDTVEYEVLSPAKVVLDGMGVRRETRMHFRMNDGRSHFADVLLFTPNAPGKFPVFVGLTPRGNHVVSHDPEIRMSGLRNPYITEEIRGMFARRFPFETILQRGYAIAIASYNDFFPDMDDAWQNSIYQLFYTAEELAARPKGVSALGAWAWGLSRMLDYLQTLPEIDGDKAAVYGQSRLGKTALWAGAADERFKLVCVNNSGCGGAALSRRLFGETLYSMCVVGTIGKYWFTDSLPPKALRPQDLPLDQHELVALVAPRAVSIHSATEDLWADPKGEYLAAYHAGDVYKLYGLKPLESAEPPPPDTPVGTHVSYALRTGKHDFLPFDWNHYLDLADRIFGNS